MGESDTVYRTKEAIRSALLALLDGGADVSSVTAKDVAAQARVSRTTFYRYYRDVYDVLVDCFVEYCVPKMRAPARGCTGEELFAFMHASALEGARLVREHRSLCLTCMGCGDRAFRAEYEERVTARAHDMAQRLAQLLEVTPQDCVIPFESVAPLCVTLQNGIFENWLRTGCVEPPEQIAVTINGVIIRFLRSLNRCLWSEWQADGVRFDTSFEV